MQKINAVISLALASLFVSVWNSAYAQTMKDVAGIWIMISRVRTQLNHIQ